MDKLLEKYLAPNYDKAIENTCEEIADSFQRAEAGGGYNSDDVIYNVYKTIMDMSHSFRKSPDEVMRYIKRKYFPIEKRVFEHNAKSWGWNTYKYDKDDGFPWEEVERYL